MKLGRRSGGVGSGGVREGKMVGSIKTYYMHL